MRLDNLRNTLTTLSSLRHPSKKETSGFSIEGDQLKLGQMSLEQEHLLAQIALKICTVFNPKEILNLLVSEVRQLFEVERVVVYRLNSDWSGVVVAESVSDHLPTLMDRTLTNPCFAQDWMASGQRGEIQSISDIYANPITPEYVNFLESLDIRAHLAIPFAKSPKATLEQRVLSLTANNPETSGHQYWGLLSLQKCSSPRQWQTGEIDFLKKLSAHVEIALQQAELYVAVRTAMLQHQWAESDAYNITTGIKQQQTDEMVRLEAINHRLRQELKKRNELEERLFQEKELSQLTIQSIGDAVITTDVEGRVQSLNPSAQMLTGWNSVQAQGCPLEQVFQIVDERTKEPLACPAKRAIELHQTVCLPKHTVLVSKDGTEYTIDDSASPIFGRNRQIMGAVIVFHDVTKSRQLEKLLSWQATHDPLTGLVNRREFETRVRTALQVVQKTDHPFVLCYLDLDRFKVINDTCGHVAGDKLLKQITVLLHQRIRTSDTLARLGGDEFGLLLHHCSIEQAQKLTEELVHLIQTHPFIWESKTYHVGVSIGVSSIDKNSKDLMAVLSAADSACYEAKRNGGNNVKIYCLIEPETEKGDHYWIGQVYSAVEEQRLQLYSQKISALTQSSDFDMSEVLLRFIDPEGNLLLPGALILAAEKFHLTRSIDQWVVKTFCEAYHHQTRINPLLYTINLSGESVNNVLFGQFLVDQIQQNKVPPDRICFEITETAAIQNLAKASDLIHSVKELGCHFALDDFGSGMSSLSYLKNLPVDFLKIDGAFIQQLASNPIDCAIVDSFNSLSHEMGILTIAEWVEDEPTLQKLKAIGVDFVQGFGVSKPSPLFLP